MVLCTGIRLKIPGFPAQERESVPESESSSLHVQSWNQTRNRILDLDSIRTRIGAGFQDWTVSAPESQSKKSEPGISDLKYVQCDYFD